MCIVVTGLAMGGTVAELAHVVARYDVAHVVRDATNDAVWRAGLEWAFVCLYLLTAFLGIAALEQSDKNHL